MYLALMGSKAEALVEAENAYELDPLSPVVGANLAKIFQEAGQPLSRLRKPSTWNPTPRSRMRYSALPTRTNTCRQRRLQNTNVRGI